MRVLITGASGFVGRHLVKELRRRYSNNIELVLTSKLRDEDCEVLDITDFDAVRSSLKRYRPTHVVHLAGIALPSLAIKDPTLAWKVNLDGTLNIANAIMQMHSECWLLHVSSGLIYGASANQVPSLDEASLLSPIGEYEASKAAADLAVGALSHRGLKSIRLRPFNHIGPGQTEDYVVSSFAKQIAQIEAGQADPVIRVGNLAAARDFLDVRDVVAAYSLALSQADKIQSGTILNIASGEAIRISDLLDKLLAMSATPIKIKVDPTRVRPVDVPMLRGNSQRARNLLGWRPNYRLDQTLAEILYECRAASLVTQF